MPASVFGGGVSGQPSIFGPPGPPPGPPEQAGPSWSQEHIHGQPRRPLSAGTLEFFEISTPRSNSRHRSFSRTATISRPALSRVRPVQTDTGGEGQEVRQGLSDSERGGSRRSDEKGTKGPYQGLPFTRNVECCHVTGSPGPCGDVPLRVRRVYHAVTLCVGSAALNGNMQG